MTNKTILIVGETGSGKSTFINSVFGEDPELEKPASVGAEFCSCTRDVEEFFYERKDGLIISLVDSPGLNNFGDGSAADSKSDTEIFQTIIDSLKTSGSESERRVVSAVVVLYSVNSPTQTEPTRKIMKQLKSLCGNDQLKNLVVVTTRWDECQSDDPRSSGEDMLERLLDSNKFLKRLSDLTVRFLRTSYIDDQVSQLPGDPDQYLSPRAIVEQLLDLEPDSEVDRDVDVETIQKPRTIVLALADEPEPPKEDLNRCMEQNWDALEDLQSVTTYAESEQTETNEDLEPRKQDINGCLEQSYNTPEDLQSVTNYADSEQTDSEMNEDPKRCCINERECRFLEFRDQLKAQEDRQMSFAESQAQVLKMLSQILERLGSQVAERTQALKPNQKQRDEPDIIKMESSCVDDISEPRAQLGEMKSERDRVEASKLETERELESTKEIFKEAKEELARLREQIQAQTNESKDRNQQMTLLQAELEEEKTRSVEQRRELADLRKQLQDGTQRITSLETELEKGKKGKKRLEEQAQGSKSELHVQRTTSLETQSEESKLRSEEKERALAKQAKGRAFKKDHHLLQVASPEMELKGSEKMLEAQAQESESTHPRNEVQDKTPSRRLSASRMAPVKSKVVKIEGRVHAQRATPLGTDSRACKQAQDFPRIEVQGPVSQYEKVIVPWEQDLRAYQNVPSPSRARTSTLAQPSQPPPSHQSSRRVSRASVHRTGKPPIPHQTVTPANQSIRFPSSNAS